MKHKDKNTNFNLIKQNFYFIVDFCQNRVYKNFELNFMNLSIIDRVLLSTYCTGLISQKIDVNDSIQKKIDQMCNLIFNFNDKKTNNINNMNMVKKAKERINLFLQQRLEYCKYIQQYKIVNFNNNEDLFRISLNSTEFNIVNKMKFKKYEYVLYTIYILGTAKNHTSCSLLNKFDLHLFSKCIKSSKLIVDKIFQLMKWKYFTVNKSVICWKSKWKMKLENNDLTKEDEIDKKIVELLK